MRLLILVTLAAAVLCAADTDNPFANRPEAIEAGRKTFAAACSACHGKTGEGGRGPNLTEGKQVRRLKDAELFQSIQAGVPGTDMPAFPLPDDKVWQLVSYVRGLSAPAYEAALSGDPVAGDAIYRKAGCAECHMIRGQGGFLGPDLSNIGMKRALRQIRESVLQPGARWAEGYRGVTILLNNGQQLAGVARDSTNYYVALLSADGTLRQVPRQDMREITFHKKSLMPDNYGTRFGAKDIENLLAFLSRQAIRTETAAVSK